MVIIYSTLAIQTPADPFNNRLLPYLNLFSWMKGANYLKNFKLTRLFIQIFIQVVKDLSVFMIFIAYCLLAFTLTWVMFRQVRIRNDTFEEKKIPEETYISQKLFEDTGLINSREANID